MDDGNPGDWEEASADIDWNQIQTIIAQAVGELASANRKNNMEIEFDLDVNEALQKFAQEDNRSFNIWFNDVLRTRLIPSLERLNPTNPPLELPGKDPWPNLSIRNYNFTPLSEKNRESEIFDYTFGGLTQRFSPIVFALRCLAQAIEEDNFFHNDGEITTSFTTIEAYQNVIQSHVYTLRTALVQSDYGRLPEGERRYEPYPWHPDIWPLLTNNRPEWEFPNPNKIPPEKEAKKRDNSRKKFDRYYTHISKDRRSFPGNLIVLGLAKLVSNTGRFGAIAITEQGAELLKISNPILDDLDERGRPKSLKSLSYEEQKFFCDQIRRTMPTETQGMHIILSWLDNGDKIPRKSIFNSFQDNEWFTQHGANSSKAQSKVIFNGLLSRLIDLGLVIKEANPYSKREYQLCITRQGFAFMQ